MNYDTVNHILWSFDDDEEPEWDEYDEADLMYAENKLNKNQR